MVDVEPWGGNYTGTIISNNTILGGFATNAEQAGETDGNNFEDAIIK